MRDHRLRCGKAVKLARLCLGGGDRKAEAKNERQRKGGKGEFRHFGFPQADQHVSLDLEGVIAAPARPVTNPVIRGLVVPFDRGNGRE